MVQAIWVFSKNNSDTSIAFTGSQWGALVLIVLTFIIFLAVLGLLLFHIYITCENTTTLAFSFPDKKVVNHPNPEPDARDGQRININIFEPPADEPPATEDRLGRK